jgi:acyl carrier protein
MEQLLADIWRDVLKVERIGAGDNFFELGGHSLHTFRVAAAVQKQLGWRMDPRTLFFQTLRQIAAMADTGIADAALTGRSH